MRILIAEDEVGIAKALKLVLEKNRFAVDMVHNGLDALEYMLSVSYDAVRQPMPGPISKTPVSLSIPAESAISSGTHAAVRKFCPMDFENRKPCRASSAFISFMFVRSIIFSVKAVFQSTGAPGRAQARPSRAYFRDRQSRLRAEAAAWPCFFCAYRCVWPLLQALLNPIQEPP